LLKWVFNACFRFTVRIKSLIAVLLRASHASKIHPGPELIHLPEDLGGRGLGVGRIAGGLYRELPVFEQQSMVFARPRMRPCIKEK